MWLDIYNHTPIWNGYDPSHGRFFPLASLDLNILMQFSNSPYLFFTYNAFIAVMFAFVYVSFLNTINKSTINLLLVSLLMLSVGFVVIFLAYVMVIK